MAPTAPEASSPLTASDPVEVVPVKVGEHDGIDRWQVARLPRGLGAPLREQTFAEVGGVTLVQEVRSVSSVNGPSRRTVVAVPMNSNDGAPVVMVPRYQTLRQRSLPPRRV
jgi:hypothetical protein